MENRIIRKDIVQLIFTRTYSNREMKYTDDKKNYSDAFYEKELNLRLIDLERIRTAIDKKIFEIKTMESSDGKSIKWDSNAYYLDRDEYLIVKEDKYELIKKYEKDNYE